MDFAKKVFSNGLTTIVHEDKSTPLAAVAVLYKVGSKNESPNKSGYAHLFEHLMFGGSYNVSDFDKVIMQAGGENNAFTNCDYTLYHDIIPAKNLESALWAEADRMFNLNLQQEVLDVQKKVILEEFNEGCLNLPYGDVWHHISDMAYTKHSYRWPTIGKTPNHIKDAQLADLKEFYNQYYHPGNAIVSIASPLPQDESMFLLEKWFGNIETRPTIQQPHIKEPSQNQKRQKIIESDVPKTAIFLSFKMVDRKNPMYYACDLLSDLLSNGKSSILYRKLVKEKSIFVDVDAYITGTFDEGLFIIEGKLKDNSKHVEALDEVWLILNDYKNGRIREEEIEKVKNKAISDLLMSRVDVLSKAILLNYFEALEDVNMINEEINQYKKVNIEDIVRMSQYIFDESKLNELIVLPKKENANN